MPQKIFLQDHLQNTRKKTNACNNLIHKINFKQHQHITISVWTVLTFFYMLSDIFQNLNKEIYLKSKMPIIANWNSIKVTSHAGLVFVCVFYLCVGKDGGPSGPSCRVNSYQAQWDRLSGIIVYKTTAVMTWCCLAEGSMDVSMTKVSLKVREHELWFDLERNGLSQVCLPKICHTWMNTSSGDT